MENELLITRRHGRGTFVNDQSSHEWAIRLSNIRTPEGQRIFGEISGILSNVSICSEAERGRLRLAKGEKVYRIQRLRTHNGRPFMVEEIAMPVALTVSPLAKRSMLGIVLSNACGTKSL